MAEKNEADLKCTICLEQFTEPKVLPCCHTFCRKCLEDTVKKSKDRKKLTCPQCRAEHQVPPNGPQGFLNDYTITDLPRKKETVSEPLCDQCDDKNRAVSFCNKCSEYLCEGCLQAHKKLKLFRDHETESTRTHMDFSTKPIMKKKTYNCSVHPEERLKLYCKTCQSLACLHCFVTDHNGHDIGSINAETRREVEQNINDLAEKADSKLTEFEANLQYISAVEKDKTEGTAPLKAKINKAVDGLIAQLETRRAKLLQEVDNSSNKDLKELWAQKEYHETAIVSFKSALSFTRRATACKEDTELLILCAQVTSRLKELNQFTWDCKTTELIEAATTTFSLHNSEPTSYRGQSVYRKQTFDLNEVGKIDRIISRPRIEISFINMPTEGHINQEVSFQVGIAVRLNDKDAAKRRYEGVEITASNRASNRMGGRKGFAYYNDSSCYVHQNPEAKSSTWTVSFTPNCRGTQYISVQVQLSYGGQLLQNKNECTIDVL